MMKPLPPLSEELVKNLEERFPNRCPDIMDTERKIWMDAGAASVVRFLRQELEHQKHNEIAGHPMPPLYFPQGVRGIV